MRLPRLILAAARTVHPIAGPKDFWRRGRFIARAWRNRQSIRSWLDAGDAGGLAASLAQRPRMIGVVEWPYLHNQWDVGQRFQAIAAHYAELNSLPWLRMGIDESRVVCELGDLVAGLRIVLDRPEWFLREGELTINLFLDDTRIYSLSFSLGRWEGRRAAFIGAMQGRNIDNIEAIYKELTKKLHGSRPRDFIFTVFQILCGAVGVEQLLGVSEECRHHRHPYFREKAQETQSANYNAIWADRGGTPSTGGFFALPAAPTVRLDSEIPSQKRPMYRRRYALFDRIRGDINRFAGVSCGESAAERLSPASTSKAVAVKSA